MMESTPHLYLSSLPYISNHSFIFRQFIPQYPQLLSIDAGQPSDLQPEIKDSVVQRHPSAHPKAVAFSPQGRQIAAGFDNGDLWVWDHVTGEVLHQMGPKRRATVVCNVTFSLDGELVYCCFKDGSILTWEAKTNQVVYDFNEGLIEGECHECTISLDGRYVAFQLHADGVLRNRVRLYERETRSKLFGENSKFYSKMMFSSSGRLFGFQSQDRVLRLWDTHTQTFVSHCVSIIEPWSLEALTDNYMVARMDPRSNFPGARVLWDIITRTKVRQFEPESNFRGNSTFSANGRYLLCSEGNKHRIWDTTTREITQFSAGRDGHDTSVIAVSPDSKYIALAMSNSTTMHVLEWNSLAQEETENLSESTHERKLQYRHCSQVWLKGQHLLLKIEDWSFPRRGYLQVSDTTGKSDVNFRVDFSDWLLVEVSPENNNWSMAYVDESQADVLRLWNICGENETILDKSDGKIITFAFSVTGDYLISSDIKGNIKILDVRTHQLISWAKCPGRITALAFSLTGATFLVAYDTDENTFVEERECSASQSTVGGPIMHDSTISSIFVTCNNTYICVYSIITKGLTKFGTLGRPPIPYRFKISNSSTGASIECFNTYLFPRLSPNRRYIAWIPTKDLKKVELWDLEKRIALDGFLFNNEVNTFEFSNDSRRISILGNACVEMDRIDIWDIETKGLVIGRLFNDSSLKGIWRSSMALYEDIMLLFDTRGMGRIWNLDMHEIMTLLYDNHLNHSQFGMLPTHLDYKTRQ